MLLSEEELSVEVAYFNYIRISKHDTASLDLLLRVSFARAHSQHSVVLEQFAAYSTGTYHEEFGVSKLVNHIISEDNPESI
jgi:hypothetical protein